MASSSDRTPKLLEPAAETAQDVWEPRPLMAWGSLVGLAFLLDALLLPGLRGSASGVSNLIDSLSVLDALLAQLLFVAGLVLAVRLQIGLLRARSSWALRALSIPCSVVCLTLLINASAGELAPLPLALVSALTALLTLVTGCFVWRRKEKEATALAAVLLSAGAGATVSTLARLTAWQATTLEPPLLPTWSPWLASAAWWLSALLTAGSLRYFVQRTSSAAGALLSLAVVAVGMSWSASIPADADASGWHVFASRAAGGLLRQPTPLIPPALALLEHLLALGAAAWAFTHRGLSPMQRIVFGFCLIALRAPDIPLLALGLLMTTLFVANRSGSTTTSGERTAIPGRRNDLHGHGDAPSQLAQSRVSD